MIRRGMNVSCDCFEISEEDLETLFQFGKIQSLLPIVWQGIKDLNIKKEWRETFEKRLARDMKAYVLRDYSLQSISKALDEESIPYILLKGSVIRDLYPEPWMRTSGDIDILVHEEHLDRAVSVIEEKTDYKKYKDDYHDVCMLSGYSHLELHFSLRENSQMIDSLLSKAWEYAYHTEAGKRYSFTPEYQIFYVVAHMSHHFLHGGLGIRPFIDLWLLQKKTVYDDNLVREMCDSCGILRFYEVSSQLAKCWLENKPVEEMMEELELYCLKGGAFGSDEQANILRQKDKSRIGYLLSRVFVPDYNARQFYKDESGEKHGYLYYQVKRWKTWLGSDKRQDLFRQTKDIMMANETSIDSTRKLIQWLGLK